jgi:hypothetical protein
MTTIKNPFGEGVFVHVGAQEEGDAIAKLVEARGAFSLEYARRQGWIGPDEKLNPEKLSLDQIMEIREQLGWKEPEIS